MANANKTTEEQLKDLGDPSGRQDSSYWDQWFEAVRGGGNSLPFEWYCSAEEVVRVLSFHIDQNKGGDAAASANCRMIHPGSGTSMVPTQLLRVFPHSHVVVDVSEVAIAETRRLHEQECHATPQNTYSRIDYLVADILRSRLPFEDGSLSCWVDKGFHDAIFSKENSSDNEVQARELFREANRLLDADSGLMLIVSLVESHSLELIMENACRDCWQPCVHIWELEPTSGDLRPFGFVLFKSQTANDEGSSRTLHWHSIDGPVQSEPTTNDAILDLVKRRVEASRERFRQSVPVVNSDAVSVRRVLLTLEIKPYNADTDLSLLSQQLRSFVWQTADEKRVRKLEPVWQPFGGTSDQETALEEIVPIGFGISKLRLQCIVPSDDIEALVEAIEEWEGSDKIAEGVQSVDVDWGRTIPVGQVGELRGKVSPA